MEELTDRFMYAMDGDDDGEHFPIAGRSTHFYSPSEVYIYIKTIISRKYPLLVNIAHKYFIYYIWTCSDSFVKNSF